MIENCDRGFAPPRQRGWDENSTFIWIAMHHDRASTGLRAVRADLSPRLWPMAGGQRLVEQSLLAVLLEPAARVAWVGGEEKGTWLCDHGMASPLAFAFCARVSSDPTGAIGRIGCSPAEEITDPCPSLETLARAMRDRQPLSWRSAGTCWRIEWA